MAEDLKDRAAFTERLRLQIQARYHGMTISAEPDRFALRITGPGIDTSLPLTPLYNACVRQPRRTSSLIAEYVGSAERQLTAAVAPVLHPSRLLWCVRSTRYLQAVQRADELIVQQLGGGLVAFVSEALPGASMRGVPLADLEAIGADEGRAREHADRNTRERFSALPERIRATDRVPADGWRLGSDQLFQGSILQVPSVLEAFAARAGGDVLLAAPDRSMILAMPASLPNAARFQMRVVKLFREAMNPCSREVLVTDGVTLREVARRRSRGGLELMAWIRD